MHCVLIPRRLSSADTALGLLETAKSTLKARQDACVNAGDSFEARQKRREEEIAALKEALGILEEHSKNSETGATFLQPGLGSLANSTSTCKVFAWGDLTISDV